MLILFSKPADADKEELLKAAADVASTAVGFEGDMFNDLAEQLAKVDLQSNKPL